MSSISSSRSPDNWQERYVGNEDQLIKKVTLNFADGTSKAYQIVVKGSFSDEQTQKLTSGVDEILKNSSNSSENALEGRLSQFKGVEFEEDTTPAKYKSLKVQVPGGDPNVRQGIGSPIPEKVKNPIPVATPSPSSAEEDPSFPYSPISSKGSSSSSQSSQVSDELSPSNNIIKEDISFQFSDGKSGVYEITRMAKEYLSEEENSKFHSDFEDIMITAGLGTKAEFDEKIETLRSREDVEPGFQIKEKI